MINRNFIYPAVALVSTGIIAFEIFMVRFFSLTQFGSFFYIPIAVTILGFSLASLVITIFQERIKKESDLYLGLSLALSIFSTSLCFLILKGLEFNPVNLFSRDTFFLTELLNIFLFYILLIFPSFFASFFIILSFHIEKNDLNTISIFNIAGGALGGIVFLFAFFLLPMKYLIFIPVIFLTSAAFLIISKEKKYKLTLAILAVISFLLPFLKLNIELMPYKDVVKAIRQGGNIIYESESPFGKLQVVENIQKPLALGLSSSYNGPKPVFHGIFIDGNRVSEFVRGDKNEANQSFTYPAFLNYTPYAIAYLLKPNASTLVLESAGGLGVMASRLFGASKVDAIEKNYQIIDLLKNKFSDWTVGIYHNQNVLFYRSGIRPFVHSVKNKKYEMIQLSLYPVEENTFRDETNYLFTVEAFTQYFQLMEKNGILMVTIPLQNPPRLELRIMRTIQEALLNQNYTIDKSIFAFKTPDNVTILVKMDGFSNLEIERALNKVKELRYEIIYPSSGKENLYAKYFNDIIKNQVEELEKYPFDISVITDNSPYLFYSLKFLSLFTLDKIPADEMAYILLLLTFAFVVVATFCLIYFPIVIRKKDFSKNLHISKVILLFGGIACGYMLIEITLIQKLNLLFSSTILSVIIVFTSFFVFSGIGAYFAKNFKKKFLGLMISLPLLMGVLLLYLLVIDNVFSLLNQTKFLTRMIGSFLFIGPLAFLMGIPFAMGLDWIRYFEEKILPWCWGINTSFSVLASVLAMVLSISFGLQGTLLFALLFYGIAFGSFVWMDYFYQKVSYLYRRYRV